MDTNNYPSYTYPDSNTSSPRSRDLDYENPPPSSFDDQSFSKVKFMVSYGGKIQPRSHDNFLSYLGGDTKILTVDRYVKFTSFYSKLASVVSPNMTSFTFKYQLPGEDLDALISVTNDEDVELMMQEFDRVMRGSIKLANARLRLFLFTDQQQVSAGSSDGRFGSANSETRISAGPVCEPVRDVKFPTPTLPLPMSVPIPVQSNADFLFGLDRMSVQQVPAGAASEQELVNQMNRLQISAQEVHHKLQLQNQQKQSALYQPKNEDSFADPYQKSSQISAGYWQTVEQPNQPPQHPSQQVQHHQPYNPQLQQQQQQQILLQQQQLQQQQQQQQQPVYMMHAPSQANAYQAQSIMRPNQGGNNLVQQTLSSEKVYREQQPVYSMPAGAQLIMPGESAAYAKQKAYENSVSGRHVFYAPGQQGGVVTPPYLGLSTSAATVVVTGGGDARSGSGDGKIVHKVTASPTVV